jgi:hypothetical protein
MSDPIIKTVKASARRAYNPPRLAKPEAEALTEKTWHSISIVGAFDTVSQRAGDVPGVLPVAPWLGSDWPGKIAVIVDRASPTAAQGIHFRLWCETKSDAKRLLVELPAFFANKATKLRGDWYGLPPDVDMLTLQLELMEFAEQRNLTVFDDEAALQMLRETTKSAAAA